MKHIEKGRWLVIAYLPAMLHLPLLVYQISH